LLKCSSTKAPCRTRRRTVRNDQKKPRYESRVFDGRIIHSAEIERIHKEVLDFERIEAISDPNARADRGPVAGAGEQAPTEGHLTPIATSILGQGRRPRRAAGNGNKKG
jgi:hypothetical protein